MLIEERIGSVSIIYVVTSDQKRKSGKGWMNRVKKTQPKEKKQKRLDESSQEPPTEREKTKAVGKSGT